MTDLSDLPEIINPERAGESHAVAAVPAAAAELLKVDLQAVALAHFGDWRANVAHVRNTLSLAVFDVSTASKLAEVRTLRQRLIGGPRAEVRKVATALKSRLAAVSKAVGAEAEEAVAAYDGLEPLITPQIDAGQLKLDEEKAERERLAEERRQAIAAEQAEISGFLVYAKTTAGMTAERVAQGIQRLEALTFGDGEWLDPAAAALVQQQTLAGMREVLTKLQAEEAAAAALEAQRAENERIAAALAAQLAEVERQTAALKAEQARIQGLNDRIDAIHAAANSFNDQTAAADIYEALVALTALDTSEAQFQEFTALAWAAQDRALAVLQDLHFKAVEREEAQRASEPAAPPVAVDANDPKARDGVAENPVQQQPDVVAGEAAAEHGAGADLVPPGVSQECAPAATAFVMVVHSDDSKSVMDELSAPADAPADTPLLRGELGSIDCGIRIVSEPEPADPIRALLDHIDAAFTGRFPSHPKPDQSWWATLRTLRNNVGA